jgi:hypothetical protein
MQFGRHQVWRVERYVNLEPRDEARPLRTGATSRHRHEEQKRDAAERIAEILYGVATSQQVIDYGLIAQRVGIKPDQLSQQLESVSRRAVDNGEPMWSALVVSVKTQRPMSGFYGMARKLRPEYEGLVDEDIWKFEIQRCYESPRIATLWLSQGWSSGSRPVLVEGEVQEVPG